MFCINCLSSKTSVVNSRPNKKRPQIWRRRHCQECGAIFTTHEKPSLSESQTIQDTAKNFNSGRLIISIANSFSHDQEKGLDSSLYLAETIESSLLAITKNGTEIELTSQLIAETTYNTLKNYDELAAIQYAAKHQLITSLKRPGRPSPAWQQRANSK